MSDHQPVTLTINGASRMISVEPRSSLADILRQELRLTALHLGCEHGVCGACNVLIGDRSVRSCLMLAVQAQGADIRTLEGLESDRRMKILKDCFRQHRALQCGFCTPGMLISALDIIATNPRPSEEAVRDGLSGNLCRCTGYQPIIAAVLDAACRIADTASEGQHG